MFDRSGLTCWAAVLVIRNAFVTANSDLVVERFTRPHLLVHLVECLGQFVNAPCQLFQRLHSQINDPPHKGEDASQGYDAPEKYNGGVASIRPEYANQRFNLFRCDIAHWIWLSR